MTGDIVQQVYDCLTLQHVADMAGKVKTTIGRTKSKKPKTVRAHCATRYKPRTRCRNGTRKRKRIVEGTPGIDTKRCGTRVKAKVSCSRWSSSRRKQAKPTWWRSVASVKIQIEHSPQLDDSSSSDNQQWWESIDEKEEDLSFSQSELLEDTSSVSRKPCEEHEIHDVRDLHIDRCELEQSVVSCRS